MSKSGSGVDIKPVELMTTPGLCSKNRKCVRKDQHEGKCWPT